MSVWIRPPSPFPMPFPHFQTKARVSHFVTMCHVSSCPKILLEENQPLEHPPQTLSSQWSVSCGIFHKKPWSKQTYIFYMVSVSLPNKMCRKMCPGQGARVLDSSVTLAHHCGTLHTENYSSSRATAVILHTGKVARGQ